MIQDSTHKFFSLVNNFKKFIVKPHYFFYDDIGYLNLKYNEFSSTNLCYFVISIRKSLVVVCRNLHSTVTTIKLLLFSTHNEKIKFFDQF